MEIFLPQAFPSNFVAYNAEPQGLGALISNSPSSYMVHFIGPNRDPITMPRRNSLFLAHYPVTHPFYPQFFGPAKRITFLHVGSQEPANMLAYSQTCNSIEFVGHISSANAVFGILSQLQEVTEVTIFIRSLQQDYLSEVYTRSGGCPSVKKLNIIMDLKYFYGLQHSDCNSSTGSECGSGDCMSSMQYSLIHLAESLLIHAEGRFPNLQSLVVELPEIDSIRKAVESLIESCHGLEMTQVDAQEVSIGAGKNLVYSPYLVSLSGDGSHGNGTRLAESESSSFLNQNGNAHGHGYAYPLLPHPQSLKYTIQSTSQLQLPPVDWSVIPQFLRSQQHQPGLFPLPSSAMRDDRENVKPNTPTNSVQAIIVKKQQESYQRVENWLNSL